jgi:hypothetical protein
MSSLTPNLGLYMPDANDDYEDFRSEFNGNMLILDGAGGGGHVIVDENGNDMPQEAKLQFTGGVNVTDDNVNGVTIVDILGGGGGGGVSNFTETVLATASSFTDMTVDFSTAYDAFIFYTNDVTYQKSENYFFTRSEITDAIDNNLVISMYPYGASGYCQYRITRSGLTRVGNSAGFFVYKIVGLNFGSTPHVYSTTEQVVGTWIDGKPIYERVMTGLSVGQNAGTSYNVPMPSPDLEQIIDSTLMSTTTQYRTMTHPPTWITNSSNLAIRSQEGDTYDTFIIAYTKTTD